MLGWRCKPEHSYLAILYNVKVMFVDYQQLYVIYDPCDRLHDVSSVEPLIANAKAGLIKNVLSG